LHYQKKNKTEEKFLYNHSEFEPTEEGLDINENGVYQSFEKVAQAEIVFAPA